MEQDETPCTVLPSFTITQTHDTMSPFQNPAFLSLMNEQPLSQETNKTNASSQVTEESPVHHHDSPPSMPALVKYQLEEFLEDDSSSRSNEQLILKNVDEKIKPLLTDKKRIATVPIIGMPCHVHLFEYTTTPGQDSEKKFSIQLDIQNNLDFWNFVHALLNAYNQQLKQTDEWIQNLSTDTVYVHFYAFVTKISALQNTLSGYRLWMNTVHKKHVEVQQEIEYWKKKYPEIMTQIVSLKKELIQTKQESDEWKKKCAGYYEQISRLCDSSWIDDKDSSAKSSLKKKKNKPQKACPPLNPSPKKTKTSSHNHQSLQQHAQQQHNQLQDNQGLICDQCIEQDAVIKSYQSKIHDLQVQLQRVQDEKARMEKEYQQVLDEQEKEHAKALKIQQEEFLQKKSAWKHQYNTMKRRAQEAEARVKEWTQQVDAMKQQYESLKCQHDKLQQDSTVQFTVMNDKYNQLEQEYALFKEDVQKKRFEYLTQFMLRSMSIQQHLPQHESTTSTVTTDLTRNDGNDSSDKSNNDNYANRNDVAVPYSNGLQHSTFYPYVLVPTTCIATPLANHHYVYDYNNKTASCSTMQNDKNESKNDQIQMDEKLKVYWNYIQQLAYANCCMSMRVEELEKKIKSTC